MRKLLSILAAVLITATVWAQSPQKMSYQAVIRDAGNKLITSHSVGMRISILKGSASGTAVYTETQTPITNPNGLVNIKIGGGTGFDAINWGDGTYFIETETDPTGGTTYTITGTSQLLSVPYALYAKTAESISATTITNSLLPPSATTQAATNLQSVAATLNGTVNANNLSSTVVFEWGLTTSYGNVALAVPSPVTGTSDVTVTANLTGLQLASTYHYRIKAYNAVNVTNSSDMFFSTLIVDAKSQGAKGDGVTDDTAALQAAIDQVAGTGGTVFIPDGTYMINTLALVDFAGQRGLSLKSNMTLQLSSGAILKAQHITSGKSGIVVDVLSANTVHITGGTIIGDRANPDPSESGDCIGVRSSSNVTIDNILLKDAHEDGLLFAYGAHNCLVDKIVCDNNRRQGCSLVADGEDGPTHDIIIQNSTFSNTNGTAPEDGIDIEPDTEGTVYNVQILNNEMFGNLGHGIEVIPMAFRSSVSNILLSGNYIHNNTKSPFYIHANAECCVTIVPYIELTPKRYEAELLSVTTSGLHDAAVSEDAGASGGNFMNFGSTAVGEWVQYTINVTTAGTYKIKVMANTTVNRGIGRLEIDGTVKGPDIDMYNVSDGYVYALTDMGNVTLSAGNHTFKFTAINKNTASSNYKLAIDYIELLRP